MLCTSRQYSRSRGGRRRRRGRRWSWWWCWDGYHCRRWCLCLSSTLRLADKRSASTHSTTLCLPPPALTVQTPVSGKLLHLRSVQCCHHEAIPSCLLHAAGQIHSVEYLRLPSCRLLGLLEGKPFVLSPTESNHGGMMSPQCVSQHRLRQLLSHAFRFTCLFRRYRVAIMP